MHFKASALLMISSSGFIQEVNVTFYTGLRSHHYRNGAVQNNGISFIIFTSITFIKTQQHKKNSLILNSPIM
jgi:hypothetical protein